MMKHRMLRMALAVCAGCTLAVSQAHADTIYFNDGTSLDGKVTYPNENSVRLGLEGGYMLFQADRVDRVEKNDKVGKYSLHNNVHHLRHNEIVMETTGLTPDEKAELFDMMKPLRSGDAREVAQAKERLLAVAQQKDIFTFLEHVTTSTTERDMPEIFDVMARIDPERTKGVMLEKVTAEHPTNRAAALKTLARLKDSENIETIAQGIVDHDPQVRQEAAEALAILGDRRATPALLKGIESNDTRVRNASMLALQQLWNEDIGADPGKWRSHWQRMQSSVSDPVDANTLKPLMKPLPPEITTAYHE